MKRRTKFLSKNNANLYEIEMRARDSGSSEGLLLAEFVNDIRAADRWASGNHGLIRSSMDEIIEWAKLFKAAAR